MCSDIRYAGDSATITVNPSPNGSLAGSTICSGGTGQFTYTSSSGTGPFTLIISGQTYSGVVSGTPFNASPSPGGTTVYTITSITDANGCVRTSGITGASATITVNPFAPGQYSRQHHLFGRNRTVYLYFLIRYRFYINNKRATLSGSSKRNSF